VRMPEGQFWPKLSRSRPKLAAGSFLFLRAPPGPLMHFVHMGTLSGTHFQQTHFNGHPLIVA